VAPVRSQKGQKIGFGNAHQSAQRMRDEEPILDPALNRAFGRADALSDIADREELCWGLWPVSFHQHHLSSPPRFRLRQQGGRRFAVPTPLRFQIGEVVIKRRKAYRPGRADSDWPQSAAKRPQSLMRLASNPRNQVEPESGNERRQRAAQAYDFRKSATAYRGAESEILFQLA
jgi:hypothetical protein